ncbi:MAG: HdeD family acid-resistance protein [Rubrobacter sp.]
MGGYAGGRGETLPWWLVLAEGVVVALLGLVLLVAPGASLVFLFWLLGVYLLVAGVLRVVGIFLDASSWGWKLAAGVLCLVAGLAILSDPLWGTALASAWLVILVGFLAVLQGAAGLIVAFRGGGWGMGALSVLGILLGLFLVINPLIGAAALTLILAIFMLVGGVGAVIQAFRMRGEAAARQPRRVR